MIQFDEHYIFQFGFGSTPSCPKTSPQPTKIQEVAWPDLAETAPANGALESPTAVPSAWGSWERPQESIQLSD